MSRRAKKTQETASHPFVRRMIEDPEFRNALHKASAPQGHPRQGQQDEGWREGARRRQQGPARARRDAGEAARGDQSLARETAAVVATSAATASAGRSCSPITAGTAVSFAACPWLRNKALDRMFGCSPREEFQYSPPPAGPAPVSDAPASAPEDPASTESPVNAA